MIEPIIIITNNNLTLENFKSRFQMEYVDGNVMDVLIRVRDHIHKGHKLLTHPIISSIKPNEVPYRTVALTAGKYDELDFDSLNIIESSILTTEKFIRAYEYPEWNKELLEDFALIDYDLINSALN